MPIAASQEARLDSHSSFSFKWDAKLHPGPRRTAAPNSQTIPPTRSRISERYRSSCGHRCSQTFHLLWFLQNRRVLLAQLWPLLVVPTAFAVFVFLNGGVAVGDRANHTPVLHLAQPLYCLLFCTGFLPQITFHPSRCKPEFTFPQRCTFLSSFLLHPATVPRHNSS